MKNTFLLLVMTMFANQLFASHFSQTGNLNQTESAYKIKDESIVKIKDLNTTKFYYDFYSDCSGLKERESGLVRTGLEEYIGASGRTHIIADIFAMYEKRAKSLGQQDFSFESNHDVDVFVIFDKKGENYTIDIYTGADALLKKESLKK